MVPLVRDVVQLLGDGELLVGTFADLHIGKYNIRDGKDETFITPFKLREEIFVSFLQQILFPSARPKSRRRNERLKLPLES